MLSLCHLLVLSRPGYAAHMATPEMQQWLDAHRAHEVQQLHRAPAGHIYLADTPQFEISATEIRQRRHQGQDCDDLLPRGGDRLHRSRGLISRLIAACYTAPLHFWLRFPGHSACP